MEGTCLTSAELDRLPRYAQREIYRLARDLRDAREKLAAGPQDSNTFADPYADSPRPLGNSPKIRFGGPDSKRTFDVQYLEGELEITGNRGGKDRMVIIPCVSNTITLAFVEKLQ